MELKVIRKEFTDVSTIGELHINGEFFCFTLEDKDRDLYQQQPIQDIAKAKIFGKTAIPYGKYDLALTYSNRFQKYMPQVLNVPGFDGIRIHAGNTDVDTLGCILCGMNKATDKIFESKIAIEKLYPILKNAEKKEKITIEISKMIPIFA
jgi:hypothetical protein